MPRLGDADFERLVADAKAKHNLSDIVSRYTTLKKRGRELSGLCPFHTEHTPSFEVNDAKGTYYCHGCGKGGDAITILTSLGGLSFMQALESLAGSDFPEVSDEVRATRRAKDAQDQAQRVGYARSVWSRGTQTPGTLVEVYARSRGVMIDLPPTVRFVQAPRWVNYETGETGPDFPAACCALQDHDGAITGIQLIFLAPDGRGKWQGQGKAKLTFGSLVGSALRLGPTADHIIVCEGPEDGWSLLQQIPEKSIWVSCGTAMLSRIRFPDMVTTVTLAGDNGNAGRKAVDEATAAYLDLGLRVQEIFPDPQFKDWNAELTAELC